VGGREDAVAAARADLHRLTQDVVRLASGRDLITVVASVRVSMIMSQDGTGDMPSVAILELIALILSDRDSAFTPSPESGAPSEFMPPDIQAAAQEALAVGSLLPFFESAPADAESTIAYFSVQREINMRNAVYPHMLLETLRGLFSDSAVNADCRAALGFSGAEAVEVMEAVRARSTEDLEKRFARLETARESIGPLRAKQKLKGKQAAPEDAVALRAAAQSVLSLIEDLDEAAVIDPGVIAERTGYERPTVEAVLDAFTLVGRPAIETSLDQFFQGDNPLRTAPIVKDAQGRRMLVHEALAMPAVREVIETRLQAASRFNAYREHRGHWVEDTAVDLLATVSPRASVFRGFDYFVRDPQAAAPQTDPAQFTKRVEGDGLILIDDVALIIEVKSNALSAGARRGDLRLLNEKLGAIVTKAAAQAGRLRDRIVADQRIRLGDGGWIDVSGIREVHTIAVGLEDLSGVTTATSALVSAGVLSPDNIPWTVSVHDLRIVCELLDRPGELLLYLRRRTHPLATQAYLAVDELDLFALFLEQGLYVPPDPREVAKSLPWTGPPTGADLRRFAGQRPEVIRNLTGPLDAWYESRTRPAAAPGRSGSEKPRLNADRRLLGLVDQITASGAPGWLSTTALLLEGDQEGRRASGNCPRDLAKLVRRDRRRRVSAHVLLETSGRHAVLIWACQAPGEEQEKASAELLDYLLAVKHQAGAYRASCLLFDPAGKHLLRLLYDNRPPGPDSALDEAAAKLPALENMERAAPGHFKGAG
jgi:hypothetical protein